MNIRRAIPDDSFALARVHVDSWRSAYRGLVPDAHLEKLDYARRADRFRQSFTADSPETYVAEQDGTITGFLTLGDCRDQDVDHKSTGEIWGIYLAPEYWHRGIGRSLCQWAEACLASRGYSAVVLWVFTDNDRARKFYEAMGFVPDGMTRVLNLGKELGVMRYRKKLGPAEAAHRD